MTRRFQGQDGFTLAELLVAVAITGLIMAGLLGLLSGGQQSYLQGSNQVEAQQNARAVLARMTQDLRFAGYDPRSAAFAAVTGQTATAFTLQNDWNGNGAIDTNVTVSVSGVNRGEQITYSVAGNALQRQESNVDAAAETVALLEPGGFDVTYLDAAGVATAVSANIRTVAVTLTIRPDIQASSTALGRSAVTVTGRARLRNRQ